MERRGKIGVLSNLKGEDPQYSVSINLLSIARRQLAD